ncbi:hypothetical protein GYMLUDRAFT_253979 [Collybiopsis luxurians FD-317 M1]|nr:hypothetical protein GYMLUDRAFT_253979 [Collybiopsis luxurians FD-317 M1]
MKSAVSSSTTSTTALRPKAKVNSSATPASARVKVSKPLSTVSPSASRALSTIPRPVSPTKSYSASPTIASQKPRIVRPNSQPHPSSTPGTPVSGYLSVEPDSETKSRYTGSLTVRQKSPPLGLGLSNGSLGSNSIFSVPSDEAADHPVKIKSKITRVALTNSESLSPSPSPSQPLGYARVRAPSISSTHSLSSTTASTKPEYTLYPTASTTANRYASNRPLEGSLFSQSFQPFSSPTLQDDVQSRKVDPTTIPLPTHSPPTSAVSFSSRSSVSRSSVSYGESTNSSTSVSTNHTKNPSGGIDLRTTLDTLVQISESNPSPREDLLSPTDDDDAESENRKARNAAKVNRKIADLEITNRSLLAINSTLEATKHRQAKEIRELRRRLRESRLILPPRTYRAVTSSEKDAAILDEDDDEDDEDDEAEEDQTYMRIRIRLDEMIESAKAALTTDPKDFVDVKSSAKVLSEQEVRHWRGDEDAGDTSLLLEVDEDERNEGPSTQVSRVPSRNGQLEEERTSKEEITSEDEVEAMTMPRDSPSPPPIVVTSSA